MRERDWNRKTEKNREGSPVVWHTVPKEAWPVVCLRCKAVRNKLSPRSQSLRSVAIPLCLLLTLPPKQFLTDEGGKEKISFIIRKWMFCALFIFFACCSYKPFYWNYLMAESGFNRQHLTSGPHYAVNSGGDWGCGKHLLVAVNEETGHLPPHSDS